MPLERLYNPRCKPAGDLLRNFGMRRVPILRLRLDCQINGLFVVPADPLKAANIDFADPFKPALGWFFEVLPEYVPVFRKRDQSKTTHGYVFSSEEARRDAFAIPFVREDCPDDVLVSSDGHRSSG